jgi:hypothetical protein
MSTFGASGAEIWRRNLACFRPAAKRMRATIADLEAKTAEATKLLEEGNGRQADGLQAALDGLDHAINLHVPSEWNIDLGYEGLLQQLDRAEAMLRKAEAAFGKSFKPDANPYAHLGESPFQLAVGSYLSAAGVFANCHLLLRLQESRFGNAIASCGAASGTGARIRATMPGEGSRLS